MNRRGFISTMAGVAGASMVAWRMPKGGMILLPDTEVIVPSPKIQLIDYQVLPEAGASPIWLPGTVQTVSGVERVWNEAIFNKYANQFRQFHSDMTLQGR